MTIIGAIFTFNDTEYLQETITSFKDAVDKLFIIEGAWQSAQLSSGCGPRSGKQTFDIIEKFVDNKNVFLISGNRQTRKKSTSITD